MPRRLPLRTSSHRARKTAALGLVGALALPLIAWSDAVVVEVDGELHEVRTYAGTVGEALEVLDVELGPADEVSPPPGAPLSDGLTIEVARAIAVEVVVDDTEVHEVLAPVGSVAEALAAADLAEVRSEGAQIDPPWSAAVEDGDVVHVTLPKPVEVVVDGDTHATETLVTTVAEVLDELEVDLDASDRVRPALWQPIEGPTEIVVQRVETGEEIVEVALAAGEQRRDDPDLLRGKTRVEREAQDGLRVDRYAVVDVDGERTQRELIEQVVVREPVDRVVLVGTKAPPPPPPPPPPPSAPKPKATADTASSGTSDGVWDRLARCESGGNWSYRGTYHGGLQFHPDTWRRHKPSGYPEFAYQASRAQQIAVGERVQRSQGWAAWPHCSRQIGLR
ncbi:transglycosylase family protein [Egicoccus sp. AB-alg6-2]|uniref:transglycosylase family protein n=1 Tax=Egicoccus sp. AB-alg6-2 TaxID=3242692 RepID=UPI00359CFB2B